MRGLQFTLAAALLMFSGASAFAQICETGKMFCPPGKNGDGGCYSRQTARCDSGAIVDDGDEAPEPDRDMSESRRPRTAEEPAKGDECRTASNGDRTGVLEALRRPVSRELKTKVEFNVERARVCGDWAFVIATPQKMDGGEIEWEGTVCAGDTSRLAGGLARREGSDWSLVDYALCPSDVAWAGWAEKYHAPKDLFAE